MVWGVVQREPIVRDADILEGQMVFAGTRVPVWVLFNYLTDERALAGFAEAYPHVAREDVLAALDRACRLLTGQDSQGEGAALRPPRGQRQA